MDEAFIYLIKVNIALVVFYLFYRLLFSQDTFFVIRRFCLWTILGVSFIYPLVVFSFEEEQKMAIQQAVVQYAPNLLPEVSVSSISGRLGYSKVLLLGYRNTFTRSDCYSIGFNRSASL